MLVADIMSAVASSAVALFTWWTLLAPLGAVGALYVGDRRPRVAAVVTIVALLVPALLLAPTAAMAPWPLRGLAAAVFSTFGRGRRADGRPARLPAVTAVLALCGSMLGCVAVLLTVMAS